MGRKNNIGCEINIDYQSRKDFSLFAEAQSCIIVSADKSSQKEIAELAEEFNTEVLKIGETKPDRLKINFDIDLPLREIDFSYFNSLGKIMEQ